MPTSYITNFCGIIIIIGVKYLIGWIPLVALRWCSGQHCRLKAKRLLVRSQQGSFCVEPAGSPCACAGSLQGHWIPFTVQIHAGYVNWQLGIGVWLAVRLSVLALR